GVAKVEASGRLRIELEASHVEHDLIAGGAGYRVGEREREIAPRAKVVVSVDRADLPVAVQHVAGLLNRRFAEVERLDGQVERTAAVPMHAVHADGRGQRCATRAERQRGYECDSDAFLGQHVFLLYRIRSAHRFRQPVPASGTGT